MSDSEQNSANEGPSRLTVGLERYAEFFLYGVWLIAVLATWLPALRVVEIGMAYGLGGLVMFLCWMRSNAGVTGAEPKAERPR